jgi:hypothetical protein
MHSSLFILLAPFLCQLATAIQTSSRHPILEPVSDDGWSNNIRRRSTKDSLKLLDNEHMVWNTASGEQQSATISIYYSVLIKLYTKGAQRISS